MIQRFRGAELAVAAGLLAVAMAIQSGRSMVGASAARAAGEQAQSTGAGVYTTEQSTRGEKAYTDACARCHSATLAGGAQLTGDVPALVGNEFLGGWVGATAAELFDRVRHEEGGASKLSTDQSADIMAYIFSKNRFPAGQSELKGSAEALTTIKIEAPGVAAPAPASAGPAVAERSVSEGVYSDAQLKRGQQTYGDSCQLCHGPELTGSQVVPALVGNDFLTKWKGMTAGDLFEQIRSTMPQGSAGTLSPQQYADLLAYIFNKNKFPVGQQDLGDEYATLRAIRIEPK